FAISGLCGAAWLCRLSRLRSNLSGRVPGWLLGASSALRSVGQRGRLLAAAVLLPVTRSIGAQKASTTAIYAGRFAANRPVFLHQAPLQSAAFCPTLAFITVFYPQTGHRFRKVRRDFDASVTSKSRPERHPRSLRQRRAVGRT